MERERIENLSDVSLALENILQRLNVLEKEIAILKGESVSAEPEFDDSEAIDLSLDELDLDAVGAAEQETSFDISPDEDIEIPEPILDDIPEPTAEDIPEGPEPSADDIPEQPIEDLPEAAIEDIPEMPIEDIPEPTIDDYPEDGVFANLFGSEFDDIPETKPKRGRRPSAGRTINDVSTGNGKAVMDVLADRSAWLHDIPGPEVKSLRSAIALGDQVLYIKRLFRNDSALYQDSIDKLNSMTTLKEAVEYLSSTFPEWDTESEDVYRFMMSVRRKIRK